MAACDACKELAKAWDASQRLMTAKFTNKITGFPTFILVQEKENNVVQSVEIAVNYCPWCGRYLRGNNDGIYKAEV